MNIPADLIPGDILLYTGTSIYDELIKLKTWSNICHVEVFWDTGTTVASRPGQGVRIYPFEPVGLVMVRRPTAFWKSHAEAWLRPMLGLPYDFSDLEKFFLLNPSGSGIVCSPLAAMCLRAGGVQAFAPDYDDRAIAPRDFTITPASTKIFTA